MYGDVNVFVWEKGCVCVGGGMCLWGCRCSVYVVCDTRVLCVYVLIVEKWKMVGLLCFLCCSACLLSSERRVAREAMW